jgi:hypothetical protein
MNRLEACSHVFEGKSAQPQALAAACEHRASSVSNRQGATGASLALGSHDGNA